MQVVNLIGVWLPIALGIVMIGAGSVNFVGPGSVRNSFARWGYPAGFHRVTGGIEVTAGLLLLIPATSRAGAMGGAAILLGRGNDADPSSRLDAPAGRHRTDEAVAVAVTIRG